MRALVAILLSLLATSAAVPAAAQPEGGYRLLSINGQPLPAPSPTEDGVTMHGASFTFQPDGTFAMQAEADNGEAQSTESTRGTWSIQGDSLRLYPEDAPGEEGPAFLWTAKGDTLQLVDEFGHRYAFARGPASAAGGPWVPGTWHAVQLNGQNLPAPWPLEPQLTVTHLSFVFTADGQASVRMAATMQGQSGEQEESARYTVTGDRLTILDEGGAVDEEFTWGIRDGTLRLVDANGYIYTFTREPAPDRPPRDGRDAEDG